MNHTLSIDPTYLALTLLLTVITGIVLTRLYSRLRWNRQVKERVREALSPALSPSFRQPLGASEQKLLKERVEVRSAISIKAPTFISELMAMSGLTMDASEFTGIVLIAACLSLLGANYFEAPLWLTLLLPLAIVAIPIIVLKIKAQAVRRKFQEQLPDAIDLMVSVLRSGHSLPQAVKSIASDCPAPLSVEFAHIDQRMNLGLTLSEALAFVQQRYKLTELDLIGRAVTIQAEVGGSLAELLDKTNVTLRGRLKLKRQIGVLTTQSRLTGFIVGLLPIFLATALEVLSPGYLNPLFTNETGKLLLILAIGLQFLGMFLMKKMTEVKA
ncbi:MAG: type II secretion system F family protein [Candidatus Obscuribacterales bacterium]|nr:type II secretion system F family protein [Candidatus Obscuribacterales bacterium]